MYSLIIYRWKLLLVVVVSHQPRSVVFIDTTIYDNKQYILDNHKGGRSITTDKGIKQKNHTESWLLVKCRWSTCR